MNLTRSQFPPYLTVTCPNFYFLHLLAIHIYVILRMNCEHDVCISVCGPSPMKQEMNSQHTHAHMHKQTQKLI